MRSWWRRLGGVVLVVVLGWLVLDGLEFGPHPGRWALVVLLGVLALFLVLDGVVETPPTWEHVPRTGSGVPRGEDERLVRFSRVVGDHLRSAGPPTPAVRDLLAELAWARLTQHHGVSPGDPRARDLLGPDLAAALAEDHHRFTAEELGHHLDTIDHL